MCGYAFGAYDKSHSFVVIQKLGASVTAIHLLVAGIVLFYTLTALKLMKDRAHLSLNRFGDTLQDVSEQVSSDIAEAIIGLQDAAEQIKTEVEVMNIRDVHDKLGRIAQSIQIAAAKPQSGQSNKDKQKSPGAQNSQPERKQSPDQEIQKQIDSPKQTDAPRNQIPERPRNDLQNSTVQARTPSREQKVHGKTKQEKQDNSAARQILSNETINTKVSQPPEKPNVSNPVTASSSKEFRPEPQPPVKQEVNDEAFV